MTAMESGAPETETPPSSAETPPPPALPKPSDPEGAAPARPSVPGEQTLAVHLRTAIDQVFDYVDRTNFATLGAIGILGLLFTVISVIGTIEQAMNVIWQAEKGRPWGRKLMDYLALMILLPIAINLGLAAMATLESPALLSRITALLSVLWIAPILLQMLPIAVVVATFTLLYRIFTPAL